MTTPPHLIQPKTESEQIALIETVIALGTSVFSCQTLDDLLTIILSKTREITYSDAGSIYLVDRSDDVLKLLFEVSQNSSHPSLSLRAFALPIDRNSLAGYVALTGESLNWEDVYNLPAGTPYKLDRNFDEDISYRTRSVLAVPIRTSQGKTIGVLQLINRKLSPDMEITQDNVLEVTRPYSLLEEKIVKALAGQAAAAIEINQLQR